MESLRTHGFMNEFCHSFKEELIPILKLFQKTGERILPNLFCDANTTLISKPDKDIRKLEANIPDEHKCKNIQNTSKTNSMTHEKNYFLCPNGIYSWDMNLFKICKSISVTILTEQKKKLT